MDDEKRNYITDIVIKYSKTVSRVAFAYTKNVCEAEDITQDVFVQLLISNIKFESEQHIKAWLIRVTINKSKNTLRNSWYSKRSNMPDDLSYISNEYNYIIDEILNLDIKYRLPIHLYYYEGYSIKEIAKILKIKVSTAGSRLDRGRKILRKSIGGVFDEE